MRPPVLCLLGPTAVGKTDVALALAQRLPVEIVGADSRQVYRGLTIGSAAPTPAQLAAVPHHLVGHLDPRQRTSVAEFKPAAEAACAAIHARGKLPLLVAGTGMWLKALLAGWSLTGVAGDEALRRELEALPDLHARLAAVDPETAARLAPADRKRLVRALEVYTLTGRPLSAQLAEAGQVEVPFEYRLVGLNRPRDVLYQRIDARVEAMLAAGWLDEVRALLDAGVTLDAPAFEGLGYRRLAAVLTDGADLAEAVAATQQDTRRFAKRQLTWFRGLPDVTWVDAEELSLAAVVEAAARTLAT